MKNLRFLFVALVLAMICGATHAQFSRRISNAVQRSAENAAERAVTRQTERRVEEAVNNAIDDAFEAAERRAEENREANSSVTITEPEPYTGPVREAPSDATKFPFEQGSYVQVSEVLGIEARQTVYFTRSGDWMATEDKSEIKVLGFSVKTDKLHIRKGNQNWDLDLSEKKGTYYESDKVQEDANAIVTAALGENPEEGVEVIDLGQENYMGYACKKTQVKYPALAMDAICLSYGTLAMKIDGTMGGIKIASRILSIDLNAPPASKFEVPAGIKIN